MVMHSSFNTYNYSGKLILLLQWEDTVNRSYIYLIEVLEGKKKNSTQVISEGIKAKDF